MVQKTKKIAFIVPEDFSWKGEENYFKSLLSAIDNTTNYKIYLFSSKNCLKKFRNLKFKNTYLIDSNFFEKKNIFNLLRKIFNKLFKKFNPILIILFKFYKIDIISHSIPVAFFKNINWFPDFQHMIIKKNFSNKEIARRDNLYENYIRNSQSNVVSSKDSKKHLLKFIKQKKIDHYSKNNVLNFVPHVNFLNLRNKKDLFRQYNLKEKYIYIPNQFWKHKNHTIIVKTVEILNKDNFFVDVILSGPKVGESKVYFKKLFQIIRAKKLSKNFSYVGEIPHSDVLSLIYYCDLFINPSYFEGWSTTVEEAKIFKKKMLLSNIAVFREQKDSNTKLFNPEDPIALANLIKKTFNKKKKLVSMSLIKSNYLEKRKKFKNNYFKIIKKI